MLRAARYAAVLTAQFLAVTSLASAGEPAPPLDQPYLTIGYGVALGQCDGELTLFPDGRFEAATHVHRDGSTLRRSGKSDPVYWNHAVDTLKTYRFAEIESVDSYYNTVPPDALDAKQRLAELQQKDAYVLLDGWTYTIDWRDEDGERHYLRASGRLADNNPMIQKLLREVQFRKRTCGYYFQPMRLG